MTRLEGHRKSSISQKTFDEARFDHAIVTRPEKVSGHSAEFSAYFFFRPADENQCAIRAMILISILWHPNFALLVLQMYC